MDGDLSLKTIIGYVTAFGLVFFYLMYMPTTMTSAFTTISGYNVGLLWLYYFTLVLGLLIPLYFAIEDEKMAILLLGLSILLNSLIVMITLPTTMAVVGGLTFIVGLLFFLQPLLEDRMADNWDLIKPIFQLIIGLLIMVSSVAFAMATVPLWTLENLLQPASYNHLMPQFIYLGGGLTVVYGVLLFLYALLKLFIKYNFLANVFGNLKKIFYMLLVLVFLIGLTYDVMIYPVLGSAWSTIVTGYTGVFPSSIQFFISFFNVLAFSLLLSLLLIFLYIFGVSKMAERTQQE
jgi:hypothetical protein